MEKFKRFRFILLVFVLLSSLNASISIRELAQPQNTVIDEDKIIKDLEREKDAELAKQKQQPKAKQTTSTISQDTTPAQNTSAQQIDLSFFVMTLIGFVLAEMIIIFTDYIKPKYFDDLY